MVDECPGCGTNHLDLFPDAFAALADPSKGIIDVTWNYVDCAITAPLQLHLKDGVSAYWFSIQVLNAKKAVKSVDVSTDGGNTWKPTTRKDYNFFENPSGFGTTSVTVKVTSVDGDAVIVKNVGVSSGASIAAANNFGSSSAAIISPQALSKSTSSEVKQAATATKAFETLAPVPQATPTSESTTTSIPGANFVEITLEPTTLVTVAGSLPSSTYPAVLTTSSVLVDSSKPTVLPEPTYPSTTSETSTISETSTVSEISTALPAITHASTVGTTSAYTIRSSLASGRVPSSTVAPSFIPVSGASQTVVGIGYLVAMCMAVLF